MPSREPAFSRHLFSDENMVISLSHRHDILEILYLFQSPCFHHSRLAGTIMRASTLRYVYLLECRILKSILSRLQRILSAFILSGYFSIRYALIKYFSNLISLLSRNYFYHQPKKSSHLSGGAAPTRLFHGLTPSTTLLSLIVAVFSRKASRGLRRLSSCHYQHDHCPYIIENASFGNGAYSRISTIDFGIWLIAFISVALNARLTKYCFLFRVVIKQFWIITSFFWRPSFAMTSIMLNKYA